MSLLQTGHCFRKARLSVIVVEEQLVADFDELGGDEDQVRVTVGRLNHHRLQLQYKQTHQLQMPVAPIIRPASSRPHRRLDSDDADIKRQDSRRAQRCSNYHSMMYKGPFNAHVCSVLQTVYYQAASHARTGAKMQSTGADIERRSSVSLSGGTSPSIGNSCSVDLSLNW